MLKIYVRQGTQLKVADGDVVPSIETAVWYDLLNPTADEDRRVERLAGVSIPSREEMQDIEMSSRLYHEDGAEFMTVTAIAQLDTDEPITTPITFILKANTLITVRHAEPKSLINFAARAQKPSAVACASGEQIMLGLIEALFDRMADSLEAAAASIDSISRTIFRRKPGEKASRTTQELQAIIEKIGRDGDLLTMIRDSLVSINRLLTYHTAVENGDKRMAKDAKSRAKVLYRDVVALGDQATFLSNKINFLLDATLGLINLQQNQIIKIFSVAAVVFLPPTLIASIYGMNFAHMPETDWQFGYAWALGLMVVSAILPYLFFKRRGWL